jgi:predicted metal-dependent phosphoesterase TrpH
VQQLSMQKISMKVYRWAFVVLVTNCFSSLLFAQAIQQDKIVWDTVITGHFVKEEVRKKIVYVPIHVPEGITAFNMQATITDTANNVLDIGLFDERGTGLGPVNGFRGWAGGVSSKQVHITKENATPSYLPGPINKGTWNVMLVPTNIKINGYDWKLNVSLEKSTTAQTAFTPKPSRQRINDKQGWYRGDLHLHDVNSDGIYTQEQLVTLSKEAGLQFIIPTNHNTNAANLNWGRYDDSSILILNGEEVTPFQENHWNAIGINPDTWVEWRYDAASKLINKYQQQVKNAGGLCVINHPFYDNDSVLDYRFPLDLFDAIEVWNGTWDVNDEYAVDWWNSLLKKGVVKTAIGASDSHKPNSKNIIAHPQTVAYSKGLNRKSIISGIQNGKCYLAENSNISVDFKVNTARSKNASVGDTIIAADNQQLSITCNVKNIDDSSVVTIISNNGTEHTFKDVKTSATLTYSLPTKSLQYIRVEIRKADRSMQALTNPVWVRSSKK